MNRLSPYNITDDLIRGELYREVRDGAENQTTGWIEHTIQPDERLMPELVAYREYGTDELKWVVLVVSGMDNYREPLAVGEVLYLPPLVWVRQRIKYWTDREAALNG
ncbi:MAG: hypothetical protein RBS57_19975 [Desulforhabdus sp.]|jgi:hypothetical protein|nr:hypothetical protein [Desulforhabdus sp.]